MFDVDIYIETTWRGPQKKAGAGMWLTAYMGKELHTRQGILWLDEGTENEMAVRCLGGALRTLTQPCNITVHTQCGYVYGALANHWIERWRINKWRRSDGEPLSHVEDWYRIDTMLSMHTYTAANEAHHSFTDVMQAELQKEAGNHTGQKNPANRINITHAGFLQNI